MKKITFLLTLLISSAAQSKCQDFIKELKVGDEVPSIKISKVLNDKSFSTEDTQSKLLILDFWNINCSACIEAMPKMSALQSQFKDAIKIITVTPDVESVASSFWNKNRYTKNLSLPIIPGDTILSRYFPHLGYPHEVWIYKRKVVAITVATYVDSNNIKRILQGDKIDWPVKYDFYPFTGKTPLFELCNDSLKYNKSIVTYAAISDYREKVSMFAGQGLIRDSLKNSTRVFFFNLPIFDAYSFYLSQTNKNLIKPTKFPRPNQVIWQVADMKRYKYIPSDTYEQEWNRKYAVCYESLQNGIDVSDEKMYQGIVFNMNLLLGLDVKWQLIDENVLILKKIQNRKTPKKVITQLGEDLLISSLIYNLNSVTTNPYIFDETNDYRTRVRIKVKSWSSLKDIKSQLNFAGFDLVEERRKIHKMFFKEKQYGGFLVDASAQYDANVRKNKFSGAILPSNDDNINFLIKHQNEPNIITDNSGIQYRVIKEGTGNVPKHNSKVLVNYEGRLINGKVFDSTYLIGTPVELQIGKIVNGLSVALLKMQEGSKWEISFPASLGFGSHTGSGMVPPNSTLIYDIELVRVLN
jgi:FKBP-type peptidyl-prolyl cis-trans isomerase/thiol-disulfide isomerase/thioredoxin